MTSCKIPAAMKSVTIEVTSGNLIKGCNGLDRAYLLVENSAASEYEIKISEGVNPPSVRKGLGVLGVKCASKTLTIIALDSSRHIDATGNLVMTFEASFAGKIALLVLKKGV